MQTKGFIVTIATALVLICIFYLSFSFVTNHYETIAEQTALKAAQIKSPDMSNEKYRKAYNQFISSIEKKKVYLGYTYQQVREKQLGLGLDLKGGMNVTLQISVPDILKVLSNNNQDKKFNKAIAMVDPSSEDFVGDFCKNYKKLAPEGNLAQIFSKRVQKIQDNPQANDSQVESYLKEEVDKMVDNSYKVLRTRIDRFGVVAPNIQKLQSTGRILLELPGIKEPERVTALLQSTANLLFFETYKLDDVIEQCLRRQWRRRSTRRQHFDRRQERCQERHHRSQGWRQHFVTGRQGQDPCCQEHRQDPHGTLRSCTR